MKILSFLVEFVKTIIFKVMTRKVMQKQAKLINIFKGLERAFSV